MVVRRLRPRRRPRGGDVHADQHRQLNEVDPQVWLADVLNRIAETPQNRLHELLPWNWQDSRRHHHAA